MNSITDKRPKGSNGIFNEQNLADTEVMDEPKGNSSKKSSSDSNLFTENNLKKKDGGDESKSNPQSSSQNNGLPQVGNPDFQQPTNFTTGNNVFPTSDNFTQNIPLGQTQAASIPIVPPGKFTPNLSNNFDLKSASALAEKTSSVKDATQVALLPVLNRKNVLGQNNGTFQQGTDEGVSLAANYKNQLDAIKKSSTDYDVFKRLVGDNQNSDLPTPNPAITADNNLSSINYNAIIGNNGIKEANLSSKMVAGDLPSEIISQREQQLKDETIKKAGAYALKINANPTTSGLLTRAILGDQNAIQQSRIITDGYKVPPSDMFYNDVQGLDALSKGLDEKYASDLTNPDYIEQKKNIQNQQAVLIDKYPEFKHQQIARIVAQQIIKDHPNPDQMMMLPYGLKAAKELGLSDEDIKSIDFDNLPIQSPLSSAVGAIYNGVINMGAGAARILGSAVGVNQDYLTSELRDATTKAAQRFEDVSGVINAPTIVDADKTSPTYLQDIANPKAGKINATFHTVENAIGNGVGNLVQFVGGTKLIGSVASGIIPSLTEKAASEVGMAGLMTIGNYEQSYEKALNVISNKPEDELKRHAFALINGLLDYYSFRGLGKVVQDLSPKITNDIAGVFKDAPSLAELKRSQLTNVLTKAIDGIKKTAGETAFVGAAQASSEVAKNIVYNVMGNPEAAKKSNEELGTNLLSGIVNLPFAIGIPVGFGKIISGVQGSYFSRENIYNAGLNPDTYLGQAKKLETDGMITPDEYSKRAQVINTSAKVVSSIPEDLNLNHNQKVAYTNSKLRELGLKAQSENIDDAALEKFYNDKIAEEVQKRTDIINGGSKEPFYVKPETNETTPTKDEVPVAQEKAGTTNEGTGEVGKETESKPSIESNDEIKVGELIDKPIVYNGKKATLFQDGQTVVAKIDGENKEYELGNINDVKDRPISDYGIEHQTSVVNINDNGNISVRGDEFVNNFSDPLQAINHDKEGNIVSVNLETPEGKKRTFRGNIAEDIAYQIHLKEINKNNETRNDFEQHINTDEAAKKEINDAGLSETSTQEPTENNEPISREKVEPKIKPTINETETTGTKEAIQPEPEKTEPKPTEVKSEQLKPESKTEPIKDLGQRARDEAAKYRSGEKKILPSFIKSKLPEGTKYSGIDINQAWAKALETFADVHDKTKDFAKAIDAGFKHIKDWFDENKVPYDEKELKDGFSDEMSAKKVEDNSGQKPPPETPENKDVESGDAGSGVGISKASLNERHGFRKLFESKSGKEVADNIFKELQSGAKNKGVKVNEHISNEVDDMAAQGQKLAPTEYNIITVGTHSMNIDRLINEAQARGENVENLLKERDKTDAVLRQLGNNAGRNLGLFNLVFNDITDSGISVARNNLSKVLGIENIPESLEELKNSDLSSFDKKRAYPYVKRIEDLLKERDEYEKNSVRNISKINDDEVQKAIKDAYEKGKNEGTSKPLDKPAREKRSKQLKDMASLLRQSDEMDKFLKGNSNITKAGFDLGSYKEIIANILEGAAKVFETGEKVSDYLKKAIENVNGFDKDKLLSDIQTIMARSSMPKKEDVVSDINKIAKNENATTITKSMVDKGLIKNVVDDIVLSDTPPEKVIEEATNELKKHLPDVTKEDVADAYVRRNEFSIDNENKLKNTVSEKKQEIKRLAVKEARLEALEKADNFHSADTKEGKSKIKSDYEKELDKRISDLQKQKSETIAANKKSSKEQQKIADINYEINRVNETKTVFERAIKNPKKASDALKAARAERDKTYEKNGLRIQRNERQPIRIEREYQKNVDKISSDENLSKDEKNNKLSELKQQRDLDLQGTKQGVLSHLSDELNDLKNQNISDANDAIDEHASLLRDINSKIDSILKGIKPTGENLDDVTNKAYEKLGKLLVDKNIPNDIKEQIRTITKNLEDNAQLTANELAAKTLKNRWQKDIDRANTKLNSGNFTELPLTPFDFRRNNELTVLNRKRETTQKGVNNLIREAYDKNRTKADRLMDLSSKLLISGVNTVAKVAEAGSLKPVMDSIVETSTGRIFNKLTDTPTTTFGVIKRGFKTLAAFKNKESANRYIEKLKGAKETALGNLQKAYEGGNKNEISKSEKAFEKADLSYAVSTLYESIDANSLKSFWEYLAHGATDLDAEMGKGIRKSINDYHTKLEKAGYVLEGWIRTHGALKASLSARNEMMRSYASTLKWMQKKGMPLNEENLALAHVIAQNDFEYGRLSNATEFSKTVSEFKNSNKLGVRLAARTLFPVSTIAINIAKRGIDYSSLGAEGWGKLARGIKEGIKLNETEGKTYDTFIDKIKDGIQQIPLQERKYINGVISRGLFGAALGAVTLWGLANGQIKYGGTWDDRKKRKVIGSDGQVLQPNEWEFFGWKAPKLFNAFINHVPEFLPIALTADYYQINTLDKDGVGANFFDTAMGEIEDRMPFMTLANIFNNPTSTLEDRFTRVPIAQDVEKEFDSKKRANKTFGEKLKNNVGLGFLNPERQDMPSGFPDAIKKDYERTTDVGFLPPKIESRIIYKGHQIDLNNKQYQDFANMVNEGRTKAATAITNDPDYNKASDEQRKKMLRSGYDYARKIAKYQFLNKYPGLRNSVEQKISNQNKVSQQQRELRAGGSGAQSNY